MKKQIIKITILINIITAIIAGNAVQAANNMVNSTNTSTKSNTSNTTNTNSSVAGTSNAKLANLGLKKYDFTGFKPDETSYDVTIPEDVKEVEVYAKTQDSQASYTVSGDKNLKIGDNKVTITVTSSDGKMKKLYYINVRRLGDPSKNPEETEEQTEQQGKKDQSDITRYSEPHTEYGWYIVGISLAIVTIALIVFIIIDDYKKPVKKSKRKNTEFYDEDAEIYQNEEQPHYNYNPDSQATKIINTEELRHMKRNSDNKGKHY